MYDDGIYAGDSPEPFHRLTPHGIVIAQVFFEFWRHDFAGEQISPVDIGAQAEKGAVLPVTVAYVAEKACIWGSTLNE